MEMTGVLGLSRETNPVGGMESAHGIIEAQNKMSYDLLFATWRTGKGDGYFSLIPRAGEQGWAAGIHARFLRLGNQELRYLKAGENGCPG